MKATDANLPSKNIKDKKSITFVGNENAADNYTDLQSNESKSAENMIATFQSDKNMPTFREFALYVSDMILRCSTMKPVAIGLCMKKINVHWRPLHDRCAPCDIKYKVIAKVRSISHL